MNTLGGNYSVLLIHPEDFTSSDGKTTLGAAICTRATKFTIWRNFEKLSAISRTIPIVAMLSTFQGSLRKLDCVFCNSLNAFPIH